MTNILVGNQDFFAIECGISEFYERLSFRALGFFVIYVNGKRYGVRTDDATMLACSFDAVKKRIKYRGQHCVPFASSDVNKIVSAYHSVMWIGDNPIGSFFGMTETEFHDIVIASNIGWTPDGDEAFDDGGNVLQFDIEDKVRLVAFINNYEFQNILSTISEIWIDSDEYYAILDEWQHRFESEWITARKNPA